MFIELNLNNNAGVVEQLLIPTDRSEYSTIQKVAASPFEPINLASKSLSSDH